jgi:hypothetical protein
MMGFRALAPDLQSSAGQILPKAFLLGINEPRRVMDLIWHHMRIEQSQKTSRINPV